ncbi:MAG: DUF5011 domain-containing protein [Mollicutes bacterium]|nr:DUF5011 domain-containing protein [Mollicutes bacterium]
MVEYNKEHMKRIRHLVFTCILAALVLSVSTYAWFVGMRTVSVNSFDIEIATTEGLALSLDGITWKNEVSISEKNYNDESVVYPNHTNSWGGAGLIPLSSIGEIDIQSSRMILYEKAGITATRGGYSLMASKVSNSVIERDGYVVFDLFIKNILGSYYDENVDEAGEEAIYLTPDSAVSVALAGGSAGAGSDGDSVVGVSGTGIENSVRVAFAQIGRVRADVENQEIIGGITCETKKDGNGKVIHTGICRGAAIWEPNDTKHVQNAINWYNKSCLKRNSDGSDVRDPNSYSNEDCNPVVNGQAYPTYAISQEIKSSDNVNVYDGLAYNDYKGSMPLLFDFPYFTDTHKLLTGTERPSLMTLAPNSITKVRVYVYLEGQDIDNYDFASIGRRISVKFGFTKQRFTEGDVDYSGPDVNQGEGPSGPDKTMPVITINGANPYYIDVGETYNDPGATARDNVDGENVTITSEVVVNTDYPGTYYVLYTATDSAGNTARKLRTVIVREPQSQGQ